MLFVVLLLIVAAGGVLVGAVGTGHPQWAWAAVVLCMLAAAVLIVTSARRHGRHPRTAAWSAATGTDEASEPAEVPEVEAASPEIAEAPDEDPAREGTASGDTVGTEVGDEPVEEDTDAADVLVVSELETTVVVVDERPRYHLEDCGWASRYDTIPLPIREARELGFTPCARCAPDAALAACQRTPG